MTIDAVRLAETYIDTIVLITGDGDFVPLVEYLKAKGIQTEVISFGRSSSLRLKEAAVDFCDLDEKSRKYVIKITHRRRNDE